MTDKSDLYALDLSAIHWETSSFTNEGGNCVQIAHLPGGAVAIRDSKNTSRPALLFTPGEYDAFVAGIESGELRRP